MTIIKGKLVREDKNYEWSNKHIADMHPEVIRAAEYDLPWNYIPESPEHTKKLMQWAYKWITGAINAPKDIEELDAWSKEMKQLIEREKQMSDDEKFQAVTTIYKRGYEKLFHGKPQPHDEPVMAFEHDIDGGKSPVWVGMPSLLLEMADNIEELRAKIESLEKSVADLYDKHW